MNISVLNHSQFFCWILENVMLFDNFSININNAVFDVNILMPITKKNIANSIIFT